MATDNDVSRRDFVKTAGAVTAAAAVVTGAPFIQKVRAANDQLQYGFIGTGSRGTYLLKHLNETEVPYQFRGLIQLQDDFWAAVRRRRRGR